MAKGPSASESLKHSLWVGGGNKQGGNDRQIRQTLTLLRSVGLLTNLEEHPSYVAAVRRDRAGCNNLATRVIHRSRSSADI